MRGTLPAHGAERSPRRANGPRGSASKRFVSFRDGLPVDPATGSGVYVVNGEWVLSPLDIAGVQHAYGRKPDGAMVNTHDAKCLDVPYGAMQNGLPLQGWDCWGGNSQRWKPRWDGTSNELEWDPPGEQKCLDVLGFATGNASVVDSWDCTPNDAAQVFSFPTFQLVGMGGNCLDIRTGTPQMYRCGTFGDATSAAEDQWSYEPVSQELQITLWVTSYRRRFPVTYCLTAAGASNGSPVSIAPCGSAVGQHWNPYYGHGTVENLDTGKCLDVSVANPSFGTADGVPVQVWDCAVHDLATAMYDGIPQAWTMRGNFVGYGGNCLDIEGVGTGDGSPAWMWQCASPSIPQQVWQYYPAPR